MPRDDVFWKWAQSMQMLRRLHWFLTDPRAPEYVRATHAATEAVLRRYWVRRFRRAMLQHIAARAETECSTALMVYAIHTDTGPPVQRQEDS